MRRVLILGATSAIAEHTARAFAARGDALYLVARDRTRLTAIAADLAIRGASSVGFEVLDVNEIAAHQPMLMRAEERLGGIDTALLAFGTLGNQQACEQSVELTLRELATNALAVVALLTPLANRFEQRGNGTIVVLSSVAGDRGRMSNYVYGSAKALVTTFLSGLRQRLQRSNVVVITIKPGFVDTPMTAAFPKGPLWVRPARVAAGILRSIDARRSVVYLPGFWRPIMLVIRSIPERIFSRLRL